MLNKLREIDDRFTELESLLQSPEVYSDPERYAKLAREQKELRPISEAYRRAVSLQNELDLNSKFTDTQTHANLFIVSQCLLTGKQYQIS